MSFPAPLRIGLAEIDAAAGRVYAAMPATPQYAWQLLSRRAGCETWVKHENHTPTGAFKVRGGLNLLEWREAERRLEREDLHPDELGDNRVRGEECGHDDEQPCRPRRK